MPTPNKYSRFKFLILSACLLGMVSCVHTDSEMKNTETSQTRISIKGTDWYVNGAITHPGSRAEGLLMNVRMVNGIFEDRNRSDFDVDANTSAFIAKIPEYREQGIQAVTLNLQGGHPGYEGALNSAFNPDGSLRDSYMHRARQVIEACDRNGMAVILGCYYQRQDQVLANAAAVRNGVVQVAAWIKKHGFTNVLLEIANEYPHGGYNHGLLKDPGEMAQLVRLARETNPELLVSASHLGHGRVDDVVATASDFLLIHYNNTALADIPDRVSALSSYGKPIVCNEDDKTGADAAWAAELSVDSGASYGLMLLDKNQFEPFIFEGAADDPVFYKTLKSLTTPGNASFNHSLVSDEPVRVFISTDIGGSDPDDFQSMVHYLVYADLFDTEGIISSPPHHGRLKQIHECINAYEKDYENLKSWSPRYPHPDSLRQMSRQGAIHIQARDLPARDISDGAQLLIERARTDDPRPLYVLVWGSITDVSQAVQAAPDIKENIRVISIGSWNTAQDVKARDYLYQQHPDLWWVENDSSFRGMYLGGVHEDDLSNRSFPESHIAGHGHLGDLFMDKKEDIKMGDTPTVLYLLRGNPDNPAGAHWGGAFVQPDPESHPNYWNDNHDPALREHSRDGAKTVNIWRVDYLRDWQLRMQRAQAPKD